MFQDLAEQGLADDVHVDPTDDGILYFKWKGYIFPGFEMFFLLFFVLHSMVKDIGFHHVLKTLCFHCHHLYASHT